jgi:hypothetical protein
MNDKEIISGFSNLARKKIGVADKKVEYTATGRMIICKGCEYRKGNRCGKCGCFLEAKTRAKTAKCPEGKW